VVTIAIDRLGEGNTSNAKSLGEGVSELKDQLRPRLSNLFRPERQGAYHSAGRRHQKALQSDIQTALRHWRTYKARKAAGRAKRK
jgi:putative component of toxin-antitoxin plasmid stabilization module